MSQNVIAINICELVVRNVSRLLDALDDLKSLNDQLAGSGIALANFESAIAADPRIGHCDSNTYLTILTAFAPNITIGLKADYEGSPTMQGWAAMQKARNR